MNARKPDCHPDRQLIAKGRCGPCYRLTRLNHFRKRDRERAKAYRRANPQEDARRQRESYRRHSNKRIVYQKTRAYGLSQEEYAALIAGGTCAVCCRVAKLTVDHNHKTGRIRGALCNSCNLGLGLFGDSAATLERATAYLYGSEKP